VNLFVWLCDMNIYEYIYIYIYIYIFMYGVKVCVEVHTCLCEDSGQYWVSSSIILHIKFIKNFRIRKEA
jgi:hypothetical protein